MTSTPDAIAPFVDAQAALLALPLDPAHREGVLHYFALAAQMAAQVMAVPLAVHEEAAAVFRPVAPEDLA